MDWVEVPKGVLDPGHLVKEEPVVHVCGERGIEDVDFHECAKVVVDPENQRIEILQRV